MFDIGWSEMAIIMLVALIVIGPKDLPRVARNVGQWVGKGRALAREFQKQLEDMAREAELDTVKREIEKAGRTDVKRSIERTIDPEGNLKTAFDTKDAQKGGAAGDKGKKLKAASGKNGGSAEGTGREAEASGSANGSVAGADAGSTAKEKAATEPAAADPQHDEAAPR